MSRRKTMGAPRLAIVIEIFAGPGEKGYSRFRSIAERFCESGYEVDVICSNFIHADKSKRPSGFFGALDTPYRVVELEEPGYTKNISFRRIASQLVFSMRLKAYLAGHRGRYDAIYCTMPDNYTALVAGGFAEREGIPFVIDVEDLLPEGFRQVLDIPLLSDALFLPWLITAEAAYAKASGIIGSSDEYRDRLFKRRCRDIPAETLYVGIDLAAFDAGADACMGSFERPEGEFWAVYTGTLGTSYDLATPIRAVASLREKGLNIRLKLAGSGSLRSELEEVAASLPDAGCDFLGYLSYPEMAALLKSADAALNSFGARAPQSIVNKVGDYLGGGAPLSTAVPARNSARWWRRRAAASTSRRSARKSSPPPSRCCSATRGCAAPWPGTRGHWRSAPSTAPLPTGAWSR